VEAEFLRSIPAFGPFLSTVLWPITKMFEYKVSGTLQHPVKEPVFLIPKMIFHPLKTLKGSGPEQPFDNTQPEAPPPPANGPDKKPN
jgi:hypothetical protein